MAKEGELHFQVGSFNTLDVSRYKDEMNIAIDEPWAGDTESGFGRNSSLTLSKAQALELAQWIFEQFDESPGDT